MSRCEGFSRQIHDPVTELIVTRRDKDALIVVKGMAYRESGVAAVTLLGGVWGI